MFAEVNHIRIHYEINGNGSRKVVLLHGWGCSTKLLEPVAKALSEQMTVLSIDFPGHGESERPPQPWGVPEYAECLHQLLRQLNFIPCSAIAHSFGARVAIQLAADCPDVFEKLVFTGAAGIRKPQSNEGQKKNSAYKRQKAVWQKVGKIGFLSGAADRAKEALIQKYGSADYKALDPEMRQTFVKVINLDLTDRLSQIRQSVLLLWGTNDQETPLWMGEKMAELIPDAGLVRLEGGSHFAYLEQIQTFNRVAGYFLMEGKA